MWPDEINTSDSGQKVVSRFIIPIPLLALSCYNVQRDIELDKVLKVK